MELRAIIGAKPSPKWQRWLGMKPKAIELGKGNVRTIYHYLYKLIEKGARFAEGCGTNADRLEDFRLQDAFASGKGKNLYIHVYNIPDTLTLRHYFSQEGLIVKDWKPIQNQVAKADSTYLRKLYGDKPSRAWSQPQPQGEK